MTVADDLRAAKALIDTPEKWTPGNDYEGTVIHALALATPPGRLAYERAKTALVAVMPTGYRHLASTFAAIETFESASTHADIMALFNRAIASATKGETP